MTGDHNVIWAWNDEWKRVWAPHPMMSPHDAPRYIHVDAPELASVMQWLDAAIVLIESELRPMNSARDALDKLEEIVK